MQKQYNHIIRAIMMFFIVTHRLQHQGQYDGSLLFGEFSCACTVPVNIDIRGANYLVTDAPGQ
jgi:hypothetical protein